jgi:hypothetical protein
MFYIRTVRESRTYQDGYIPEGIYSFSSKIMIPMALRYNADLMFEDTGTELTVRKYRDHEPTEQEMMWIALQSKFVK